jgi:hypothetical protein
MFRYVYAPFNVPVHYDTDDVPPVPAAESKKKQSFKTYIKNKVVQKAQNSKSNIMK